MTARRQILGLSAFALLSAAVVFNALYLQGVKRQPLRMDAARIEGNSSPAAAVAQLMAPPTTAAETIAAVQRELDQRGYDPGPADGSPNPVLRAAILAFEADQGLALTAEPSESVLQAIILGPGVGAEAPPNGAMRPAPAAEKLITRVQRDLAALGYGPFTTPGRISDEMARAIAKFERDQKLAPTGKITAALVARLMRVAPQEPKRASG